MKKYDAIVAGYICVDLTPDFRKEEVVTTISKLFKPGSLIEIEGISFLPGGVVANTGMAIKKFNKKVFLNGLVGNDIIGKALLEWLGTYGISDGIQITKKVGTAFSIVIAPPGIDRIFLESTGCNQIFDMQTINYEAVAQSRIFHFGYPPLMKQFYSKGGSQMAKMFSKVQGLGVVTSLDFSLPDTKSESAKLNWKKILKRVLPFVDIFTPSLEEALQLMMPLEYAEFQSQVGNKEIINKVSMDTIRHLGKQFIGYGVNILLIKAGHRGAYLLTGDISSINEKLGNILNQESWANNELWCNSFPADQDKVKNANGAGDTAVAAFISAILEGESPEKAIKYATIAGRDSLYCDDIYNDMVNWGQLTEKIKTEYNELISF